MKSQRLLIALTVLNLGLLVFLLAQVEVRFLGFRVLGSAEVHQRRIGAARSRARDHRRRGKNARKHQGLHAASVLPDGTTYPETVLLRLINSQGTPNVKLAATEDGSGLVLSGEANPTHVQILARGPTVSLKLANKDGQQQSITP